jgi:galactose mutarotase-like enzyme
LVRIISERESAQDYQLCFEQPAEEINFTYASGEAAALPLQNGILPLSHKLFENGALYVNSLRSRWLELRSTKNSFSVRVNREEFPYLIIWTRPEEGASYLCIEPCTSIGHNEPSLFDRKGIKILKDGAEYSAHYSLVINN